MKRNEFLKSIGKGAALTLALGCFGGCAVENLKPDVVTDVDLEIDLTDAKYVSLENPGGYVVLNNQIVVARTLSNDLVAATRVCSHDPRRAIRLRNNEWYCPEHGARFSLAGQGLNSRGSNGLTIYQTSLTGNLLRIYS